MMQAPVWALIGQANVYSSSAGQHRYELVNQFIARIDEWWLFGTQSTSHWASYEGCTRCMIDVANNYVRIGVNGGLITLFAFLLLLWCAFKSLGAAMRLSTNDAERTFLWSLGASLFVHMVGFFGLAYYDQIVFVFALLLGLISAVSASVLVRQSVPLRRTAKKSPTSPMLAHPIGMNREDHVCRMG
jgi:hypothetical protein